MATLDVPLTLSPRGRRGPPDPTAGLGRVPKVSRLMAAAVRGADLIGTGAVADRAALARRFGLTRARVTQVLSLLHLAPDLQEALLFLPRVTAGRDPLALRDLLPVAAELDWAVQRRMWKQLKPDG